MSVRLLRVPLLPVTPVRLILHTHPRVEPLSVQIKQVDTVPGGLEPGSRTTGCMRRQGIAAVMRDDHKGRPDVTAGVTAVLRHGLSRELDLCGESSTTAAP